jgi:hypothetical protein
MAQEGGVHSAAMSGVVAAVAAVPACVGGAVLLVVQAVDSGSGSALGAGERLQR